MGLLHHRTYANGASTLSNIADPRDYVLTYDTDFPSPATASRSLIYYKPHSRDAPTQPVVHCAGLYRFSRHGTHRALWIALESR
jgi:hypothetical protein